MTGRGKKIRWTLTAVLIAAGFVGVFLWLHREGPIGPQGFQQLRHGMSLTEVQAILGKPTPRYPLVGASRLEQVLDSNGVHPKRWLLWVAREHAIEVDLDAEDRVTAGRLRRINRSSAPWRDVGRWLTGGKG